jgi:beta-phosphoglucomutase-like phosphatase (HAD superfamily)
VIDDAVDFDALIGKWRAAFEAAQAALRASSHDLATPELRVWSQRLADERTETVRVLDGLARERGMKDSLVRLVASPWETKRMLGLPANVDACVFNVDGVLVASAAIHAEAWKEIFDEFIGRHIGRERTGGSLALFSVEVDYPRHVHGKERAEAVREFLGSRGISLPNGRPDDSPDAETVNGLANRKVRALLRRLDERGVRAFARSRLYLELVRDAKVRCAVVSGSTNVDVVLRRAHLRELIDECVDGNAARAESLRRKPAPDMLLAACLRLGVDPERTVVFETTPDGVAAGRAGGFELIVAVDRDGRAPALRASGADLVIADLGELLERQLAV